MSNREKMGWEEKSFYITLAIGLVLGVWCVVDFDSLARIVNSPVTAIVVPTVIIVAFFVTLSVLIAPNIAEIIKIRKEQDQKLGAEKKNRMQK